MMFITLPTLALLALSHFSLQVAANSGYYETCNSLQLVEGPSSDPDLSVVANCAYAGGSGNYNVENWINLDNCFSNENGVLYPQLNGGFSYSCSDYSLNGAILYATCRNNAGNYVGTSIDTDNYIGNQNGDMMCFNEL